jgi:hypothetical protein
VKSYERSADVPLIGSAFFFTEHIPGAQYTMALKTGDASAKNFITSDA